MLEAPTTDTPTVKDRVVYLDGEGARGLFAVLHHDDEVPVQGTVVIVPPFGYDAVCAHRSLRSWARTLAAVGRPTLVLDLPGTGDSAGGPREPDLLEQWTAAVAIAATWLGEEVGPARSAVIGLGLGGLVATRAARLGAPIEDLVLWNVPARGRRLVRELAAFGRLGQAPQEHFVFDPEVAPPLPQGALEAGGYLLDAPTATALGEVDLADSTPWPPHGGRRVLLIGRDGAGPDPTLVRGLTAAGLEVTTREGEGWGAMVNSPHLAVQPVAVVSDGTAWLSEVNEQATDPVGSEHARRATTSSPRLLLEGGVTERPLRLESPGGRLFAVLAEPTHPPTGGSPELTVVLLNVGAERHVGANRLWVELARRWAARGVPVVRLDLLRIGDADGSDEAGGMPPGSLYSELYGQQALGALDALEAHGLPGRFLIAGICSGAYWAFQLAVRDPRVVCSLPLNARLLRFDPQLARDEAVGGQAQPLSLGIAFRQRADAWFRSPAAAWLRVQLRRPRVASFIHRAWGRLTRGDELDMLFDQLRDRGQAMTILLSPGEGLYGELRREGRLARAARWPTLTVELVDAPEDTHTFQFVRLQATLHRRLDVVLEAELARTPFARSDVPA